MSTPLPLLAASALALAVTEPAARPTPTTAQATTAPTDATRAEATQTDAAEPQAERPAEAALELGDLRAAVRAIGLEWSDAQLERMLPGVREHLAGYTALRAVPLSNDVPPALVFSPLVPGVTAYADRVQAVPLPLLDPESEAASAVRRPADLEELAWADIATLAALVRTRRVSCRELAELSIARLRRLDPTLHCVVTLTEERALARAYALDRELAAGRWRGPLHGIPWGAKDLLAVAGAPTTWGAAPYRDQVIAEDAEVVRRLDAAGAVLVAKLSLGALAMGDVWFGGRTRNPWKPERGSSGSSAGSAAAVAAGCVPFALGSETYGSIVSPSAHCGCTSLRPTFGRVPRTGAMALAWSMDKLGPIARSVTDLGLVLDAIAGPDGVDATCVEAPFTPPGHAAVRGLRVGYVPERFAADAPERGVLVDLEALGVELVPVALPERELAPLLLTLFVECATAFDELTNTGRDAELTRQDPGAWPNLFRQARLVPAVEYLRANRVRTLLMRETHAALAGVDLYVHPSFGGEDLVIGNLTGLPTVVLPCGFRADGTPRSVCFTGRLFGETTLLAVAGAWQRATDHHRRHPDL